MLLPNVIQGNESSFKRKVVSNRIFTELIRDCEERFSIDSLNMSMSEWVTKNTTLKGRPFTLQEYMFQKQIIDDMHPNMDVIKPSQVGATEVQLRKALGFLVRNNGTSLIYSLPTEDMYERISKGRVKPIVDADKVFNTPYDKMNKSVRSAGMMQFRQSFLYLVPAIESAATSIAADFVINDEVDLSDQKMITLFNSRLQGSKYKISQRFSTPTFPSYGVDSGYQSSDQHEYSCRCSSCNHINFPEFTRDFLHLPGLPDNVEKLHDITIEMQDMLDLDAAFIMCEKCGARLDLDDVSKREWVAKYPSRTSSRGYKITPFATERLNPKYIITSLWRYQKTEFLRGWYNTVLGLPYSDGSIQVPEELIKECMINPAEGTASEYDDVWVGIDMGQICHIIIAKGPDETNLHIIKMMAVHVNDLPSTIEKICEDYPVRGGAIDRHPYTPTAEEIYKISKGRIVPVEYRGQKDINVVYNDYQELTHVQVNHTSFLDNFINNLRKKNIKISGYGPYKETYINHIRDMVRDEKPETPAVWKKLSGNDHYLHASAFCAISPKIAELANFKSKSDNRTMTNLSIITVNDGTFNLVGFKDGKQRLNGFNTDGS